MEVLPFIVLMLVVLLIAVMVFGNLLRTENEVVDSAVENINKIPIFPTE